MQLWCALVSRCSSDYNWKPWALRQPSISAAARTVTMLSTRESFVLHLILSKDLDERYENLSYMAHLSGELGLGMKGHEVEIIIS